MFVPCQLGPRSCLHAVVLCNKIRAGRTTFLLLITNVCHTNTFSKTDLPTVTQDACDRAQTASHRRGKTSLFPRGPLAVPLTSQREISLFSLLWILLTPASLWKLLSFLFQKGIYWTSQATYYTLNKPAYYMPHALLLNAGLLLFERIVLFVT